MSTPQEPHSRQFSHVNGTGQDIIDRVAVAELCKGWPVYRDASEWMNFRSLFTDDAQVWTSQFPNANSSPPRLTPIAAWSGVQTIDGFIEVSKAGKAKGAFIQHRECGTLVELHSDAGRAVGKMKATITQRFVEPGTGIEYDVDCDCRFLFFCERQGAAGVSGNGGTSTWKARYVKLVYEKDKVVPADGLRAPTFSPEALGKFPEGYKYLGAAQQLLGYQIDLKLATVKDQTTWKQMYVSMEKWLLGKDADLFW
jgi:SnoaL-like protein